MTEVDYYAIGQRIRKYRKAHSLSQEDLAEKIGISTTHMSHIETGNTKLSLAVLAKLSSVLEVNTDDILFGHPQSSNSAMMDHIFSLLEGCDSQELAVMLDILQTTKISLAKHF